MDSPRPALLFQRSLALRAPCWLQSNIWKSVSTKHEPACCMEWHRSGKSWAWYTWIPQCARHPQKSSFMHHRYAHCVGMHQSSTCQPGAAQGRHASACHLCLFEDLGPMQLLQPLSCRYMCPAAIWTEAGRTGVLHSSLWLVWTAICAPGTVWPHLLMWL